MILFSINLDATDSIANLNKSIIIRFVGRLDEIVARLDSKPEKKHDTGFS